LKGERTKWFFNSLTACWQELTGKPGELSRENRGFNVVSLYMILLLAILIPLDIYLGLWEIAAGLAVTEGMLITMFLLSRYRGLHRVGLTVYAIHSYLLIIFTYLYNGGNAGPALYFFLLTYSLLIAFTAQRLHWVWTGLHLVLSVGLLVGEYVYPSIVMIGYDSKSSRFTDLTTSFPIIIICMFAATSYLRKAYERERAAAELQNNLLQQANREKIELISILGHDLRNPLNALTGTLEILTREDLSSEVEKKLKGELLVSAYHTSDLLNNVLAWVSGQIKGINPLFTWVDPEMIIERVLAVQGLMAEKKGIAIQLDVKKGIKVLADAEMLEVIIRNLISNALKFTPQKGTIRIAVTEDLVSNQCTISIDDDGVGIPDGDLKNIFNVRIQSTYGTESEKGIGLGLFLCRELTLRLNGKIWAESELGKGSVFFLTLPLYTHDNPTDRFPMQKNVFQTFH